MVETTWLSRYPRLIEIPYDQGKEFIGHEFKKYLIEKEYWITVKPSTSGNPVSNALLERIHQVLGNIVWTFNISTQTYVDKNDLWTGILAAAAFSFRSTTNSQKGYSPIQLILGRDTILPIKYRVDWELIRQQKYMQINRDYIRENKYSADYDYKVRYDIILTKNTAYKYKTPYAGPFVIMRCWNNGTV